MAQQQGLTTQQTMQAGTGLVQNRHRKLFTESCPLILVVV